MSEEKDTKWAAAQFPPSLRDIGTRTILHPERHNVMRIEDDKVDTFFSPQKNNKQVFCSQRPKTLAHLRPSVVLSSAANLERESHSLRRARRLIRRQLRRDCSDITFRRRLRAPYGKACCTPPIRWADQNTEEWNFFSLSLRSALNP
ncbi:hypothetical protein CEXT_777811 [Caerostris extrusa]|uniref:Uncharacterized protein n=1 Tax=Caerostris extrusa TaxID=172846 RepID=A0AAV4WYC7_CAEEX|nr:hypothetical protein CEXT_777811 [Caerostris extrusa]